MKFLSMAVCVPSKGRPEIFYKKTQKILKHTNINWQVFVEPQDYEKYTEYIPKSHIVCLPLNNQGMGYALSCIKLWGLQHDYDYIFKMDDDVNHWYDHTRVSPKNKQGGMIDSVQTILNLAGEIVGDEELLGGLSFPQKYFHGDWRYFTHVNKMFEGLYVVRTEDWLVDPDLRGNHEEFLASASLVCSGKVILRVGKYCWDANMSTLDGGFQSFDRQAEQEMDFNLMAEKYPEFMQYTRKREYKQKSGVTWTVTDKSFFNRQNSVKIKVDPSLSSPKDAQACLSKLLS